MAAWTSYDLKRRQALVEELQSRVAAVGVPRAHPFWGCRRGGPAADRDRPAPRPGPRRADRDRSAPRGGRPRWPRSSACRPSTSRADAERLLRAARRAAKAVQLTGADVASREWTERRGEIHELLGAGTKLAQLHQRHDDVLVPEAWDEDLREARQGLNAAGRAVVAILLAELPPGAAARSPDSAARRRPGGSRSSSS